MITKRSNHMPMLMRIDSDEQDRDARARLLEPEDLRDEHVAGDHRPVGPGVGAEGAVDERELLVRVAAVPGDEELHRVGVADHRPGHEHDLRHVVEVAEGDDVLEAERLAADHHQRQHHGEAGEDRAGDEVGREDRRVPARAAARPRSPSTRSSGPRAPAASRGRRGSGRPSRSGASAAREPRQPRAKRP